MEVSKRFDSMLQHCMEVSKQFDSMLQHCMEVSKQFDWMLRHCMEVSPVGILMLQRAGRFPMSGFRCCSVQGASINRYNRKTSQNRNIFAI